MSTDITINDRVRTARQAIGLSQQAFADKIGISQGYLGDIERGRAGPSASFLSLITMNTDISVDWLLTGVGSMLRNEHQERVGEPRIPYGNDDLSPRQRSLLTLFGALDEGAQREILAVAKEKKRLLDLEARLQEMDERIKHL